jgi:hypothetical protein
MFSENGSVSSMRVMSMISLLAAITLAVAGKNDCVTAFLLFAGGGKVVSKFAETKTSTTIEKD